jgi:DNA-binding GntR family transcriptional regulator
MARNRGFEPVHRESTAGLIARQLREAIMYGDIAPASQLSESELSAQFGVSRGPLREAMQRLVQEGLLRSEPNRGLFVLELDDDDIRDIYAARTAIEGAAAVIVLRAANNPTIALLREACEAMVRAAERDERANLSDADLRFHEVLVRESKSPRLARMHVTLLAETRMCMTALEETYRDPSAVAQEHSLIVDAIAGGDASQVLQRIEDHMQDALQRLVPSP